LRQFHQPARARYLGGVQAVGAGGVGRFLVGGPRTSAPTATARSRSTPGAPSGAPPSTSDRVPAQLAA
ncbi:hypothetical protein ABVB25_35520, partial [Streptomyces anthocyanicus]|uniref:hypothetical protein n=1 Tax=Streptomyces anthocyanicus TaxID=68174 RepID=UPI00336A15AA